MKLYLQRKECMKMGKTLVAYFSASGTTQAIAKTLAEVAGADLYEIKPQVAYTSADLDWTNPKSRSSIEMKDLDFRPPMAENAVNIAEYDTILLGFPVWWYIAPTIINTFMESHDFTGKNIISFATSGGSGIEKCENNLKNQYPKSNWLKGKLFIGGASKQQLVQWVSELNL